MIFVRHLQTPKVLSRFVAASAALAFQSADLRAQSPYGTMSRPVVQLLAPVSADRPATPIQLPGVADPAPGAWSVDAYVAEVLARNPSIAQMVAAQNALAAKFPQATSLDDPMFGVSAGPGAWGNNTVNGGYRIEVAQKLPFFGKRQLRGANALAEARAGEGDVDDVKLQLIESAKIAYYDYLLVQQSAQINVDNLTLLKDFHGNAENRYRTGLAPQQDVLQAEVEIGRQKERLLDLEQMRQTTIARINTLMHLPPDENLPASPTPPRVAAPMGDAAALRTLAISRRPDLQALMQRIAAEEANVALARKEYLPDFEIAAAYDTFWQETPLRAQVGVRVNLPTRWTKRAAAISEAMSRVAQKKAELDRQIDQVNYQVQDAWAQVKRAERATQLYAESIIPAAKANVAAAQAAYSTGKVPFLSLIEAQRSLVSLRDRQVEILADLHRKRATLERVIGGPIP